jgi:glycosyltransferase involved in cell wall biosynthesis
MNIIILGSREPIPPIKGGAIEKLAWNLARFLVKAKHNVVLITTCENYNGNIIRNVLGGVETVCISKPIPGARFYIKDMPYFSIRARKIVENMLIQELQKDETLIHSAYFYNLQAFQRFDKTPIVVTEFEHYPWIPEYLYHRPFMRGGHLLRWELDSLVRIALAQTILPIANAIVFVSKYQRENALKHIAFIKHKSVVIPNGVDTEVYKPIKLGEDKEKIAGSSELILGFVGRLTPHKGLHILLKAIGKLEPSYRNKLKLIIVGPKAPGFRSGKHRQLDPYVQYIHYLLEKYNLKNIVKFVGQVKEEEMPHYYNVIDALAHPSFIEAFGLVLIEAMACGKPVIAFNIPPMNEIIINNVTGLLVDPSIEKLASVLTFTIIDNSAILKPLGEMAKTIIKHKYSWNVVINKYVELYKKVLGSRS